MIASLLYLTTSYPNQSFSVKVYTWYQANSINLTTIKNIIWRDSQSTPILCIN